MLTMELYSVKTKEADILAGFSLLTKNYNYTMKKTTQIRL